MVIHFAWLGALALKQINGWVLYQAARSYGFSRLYRRILLANKAHAPNAETELRIKYLVRVGSIKRTALMFAFTLFLFRQHSERHSSHTTR